MTYNGVGIPEKRPWSLIIFSFKILLQIICFYKFLHQRPFNKDLDKKNCPSPDFLPWSQSPCACKNRKGLVSLYPLSGNASGAYCNRHKGFSNYGSTLPADNFCNFYSIFFLGDLDKFVNISTSVQIDRNNFCMMKSF